jgi:Pyridoxamine 5'-phosphate oxidase
MSPPCAPTSERVPGDPLTSEALAFLEKHSTMFLLMHRLDGTPTGYPMVGRLHDGALEFSTYRKSAKVRRLERDGRVCVVVVPRDRAREPRVLAVWGRAETTTADPERWQRAAEAARSPSEIEVPASVRRKVSDRLASGKRTVVRVTLLTAQFLEDAAHAR